MNIALLDKYDQRVPRYTSYPTAPHFHADVSAATYRDWLGELDPELPLSLYFHIPFCDSLCWFCGCHTKIVRRYAPIGAYMELLLRELDMVADLLGERRRVCHVHLGGGTPTILSPQDMERLFERMRARFEVLADADIAVEIDPRDLDLDLVPTLAKVGVNRASLGVQDVNPEVQEAVNRIQPREQTKRVAEALRAAGIPSINVDLMYGLPHQDLERVLTTVDAVVADLAPERLCIFGYAHVPWMKSHQRLIDEAALPDPEARFTEYMEAAARLQRHGYEWIGLDHFARPDDPLAVAARAHTMHRNFQGYTTDDAPVRLGFGPSAIGTMPQGYIQNVVPMHTYREAVEAGELPVARGCAFTDDDRLHAAIIEELMSYLSVDLDEVCARFGHDAAEFDDELAGMDDLVADGIAVVEGRTVRVTEMGRPFVRTVCARFDAYLRPGEQRHARAV